MIDWKNPKMPIMHGPKIIRFVIHVTEILGKKWFQIVSGRAFVSVSVH